MPMLLIETGWLLIGMGWHARVQELLPLSPTPTQQCIRKHTLLLNTYLPSQSFPMCCYSPFGVLSSLSLQGNNILQETE